MLVQKATTMGYMYCLDIVVSQNTARNENQHSSNINPIKL